MKIGLRHIRYFAVVADELHFRRAADRLNIAQPSLTRSIKLLEDQLGVEILTRTNRKVQLTNAGRVFLKGVQSTLATLDQTVSNTQKFASGESGSLRIGYTDFAIAGELPQILRDFRLAHPEIELEPFHNVTKKQLQDMDEGDLDFGFVIGPIDRNDLNELLIQRDPYVVVLYQNHPLASQKTVTLSSLQNEHFVLGTPSDWQYFNEHLYRLCRRAGFSPDTVQHAYNSEGIFGLVACEMGISIHTTYTDSYLRKGLITKRLHDVDDTLPTVAVWKDDNDQPARATFARFLQNYSETRRLPVTYS